MICIPPARPPTAPPATVPHIPTSAELDHCAIRPQSSRSHTRHYLRPALGRSPP
jgi:hypothetical protein